MHPTYVVLNKWPCKLAHDCMVYKTAAVSRSTSLETTKRSCQHITLVYIKKSTTKIVTHSEPHATWAQWVCWRAENSANIKAINNNNNNLHNILWSQNITLAVLIISHWHTAMHQGRLCSVWILLLQKRYGQRTKPLLLPMVVKTMTEMEKELSYYHYQW